MDGWMALWLRNVYCKGLKEAVMGGDTECDTKVGKEGATSHCTFFKQNVRPPLALCVMCERFHTKWCCHVESCDDDKLSSLLHPLSSVPCIYI